MLYDTFIARDAGKANKPNKANTTKKVINAYDAARPNITNALGCNDTTGTHLRFYLKTKKMTIIIAAPCADAAR